MRASDGKALSWREMGVAGGVGLATLNHHFGKRDEIVSAVLKLKRDEGSEPLSILATPSSKNLKRSLTDALQHMILGLTNFDVGDLVGIGFSEGLYHSSIGPQFVREGLEPIITAVEARLQAHEDRGDFPKGKCLRHVSIILVSPVLLSYTHQFPLNGRCEFPTELDDIARQSAATTSSYLK